MLISTAYLSICISNNCFHAKIYLRLEALIYENKICAPNKTLAANKICAP